MILRSFIFFAKRRLQIHLFIHYIRNSIMRTKIFTSLINIREIWTAEYKRINRQCDRLYRKADRTLYSTRFSIFHSPPPSSLLPSPLRATIIVLPNRALIYDVCKSARRTPWLCQRTLAVPKIVYRSSEHKTRRACFRRD